MISLPTRAQWKSVVTNTLLAFVSAFAIALSTSTDLNTATVKAAAVAGLMACWKTIQKLLTEPKLS
jgi:hypothetical protein